jgi:hypothetical protein
MGEWALIVTVHMGLLTPNSSTTYFPSQAACEMQAAQINAPMADQNIQPAAGRAAAGDKAKSLLVATCRPRNPQPSK